MPCECSDETRARPSPVPTTMPMTAPKTARITDSERIMARIWRRFMPTAAQQPDLVGALEHRQHERVDDPDEGDDHGQGEQRVDEAEQLVDLCRLRRLELGPRLDLHVRIGGQRVLDRLLHPRAAVGLQEHRDGQRVLEVGEEEARRRRGSFPIRALGW